MGCQPSNLQEEIAVRRVESQSQERRRLSTGREETRMNSIIFRKLYGEDGRLCAKIERVCKILTANKNINLFTSFQQVEILKKLNHPNIVQIVEYFTQPKFLYIIMENIPGHSLHEMYYLQEMRNLQVIIQIVKQILIALRFCHQKGYYHKSINPEHIMVVKLQKNKSYLVKLVGFGHALRAGAHKLQKKLSKEDPIFTPPELDSQRFADKQDAWGCGIIFLELISGERKFQNFLQRKAIIIKQILKKQIMPQDQKYLLMDFLTKILEVSPQKRISVEQALDHGIFFMNYQKTIYVQQNNQQVINKLLQFRVENNLKSLFHIYVSLNILSIEQKSEYLLQFYNLDKNKDGKIDFHELVQGLQNTLEVDRQVAQERVGKIFEECNKEKEHYLQFHQFVAATTLVSKQFYEHKLVKLFGQLDQNKDGKITLEELSRAIDGIHCSQLLSNYKNHQITFDEFKSLLVDLFQEESTVFAQK